MNAADRFRVHDISARVEDESVKVLNLGLRGLYLATTRCLPPGYGVEIELGLLPLHRPIRIRGRVAWVNNGHVRDLPRGIGLRITHIRYLDKLALVETLSRPEIAAQRLPRDKAAS